MILDFATLFDITLRRFFMLILRRQYAAFADFLPLDIFIMLYCR